MFIWIFLLLKNTHIYTDMLETEKKKKYLYL